MDDGARDAIVAETLAGRSLRAIAAERDISVEQVRVALDDAALAMQKGEALRRDILVEKGRLDELLRVFYLQAKTGDVASGALYGKLSERKASLLGLNAPIAQAVTIAHADAPPPLTSTQRLRAIFDEEAGISPRERLLEDRERAGEALSDDEFEELSRYRSEHEDEHRREHDEQEAARIARRARANGG